MAGYQIGLGQADVAADHVERRVAEDLLEAEYVAAVDEIAASERMAERMRAAAGPDRRPSPEAGDRELDAARRGPEPQRPQKSGSPAATASRVAR